MAFTVASWNIEHFGKKRSGETATQSRARIRRVIDFLVGTLDADVYAIYEVNGAAVFDDVKTEMAEYSWKITEGGGSQQILIGHRINPVFITERTEFTRGFSGPLRPGVLVTVTHEGKDFPMLFLHLKAADAPIDFGVRGNQHDHARSLRKAVDRASPNPRANFLIAGDLNNVGMNLTFSSSDITPRDELDRLARMYGSSRDAMALLAKNHPFTFSNGSASSTPPADLDHVVAAKTIEFDLSRSGAPVEVLGWPDESTTGRQDVWIRDFSDHAALRFTIVDGA